jgi:iron complex outermembrane receptor protein
VELASVVQPLSGFRVYGSYTYLNTEITRDATSRDVSGGLYEKNDPHHLFTLRASADVGRRVEADVWFRGVSELPNPAVPAFTEMNARLGWRASTRIELALVGQDLLHAHHPEFGDAAASRIEFERSVRASVTIRVP